MNNLNVLKLGFFGIIIDISIYWLFVWLFSAQKKWFQQ